MPMRKLSAVIVEDDPIFANMLLHHLRMEGFNCAVKSSADEALNVINQEETPDAFIIDYNLGADLTGLDICRQVKSRTKSAVLMLTGVESEDTVVRCLDAGADHYIVKPYRRGELLARIRSALRHRKATQANEATGNGQYMLDGQSRTISDGKNSVALTELETALMEFLLCNLSNEVSREKIHQTLYGVGPTPQNRSIDVLVGRLRKKLKVLGSPYVIHHIRGFGYRMSEVKT
jgi:DNA-binding response OmpR family regulator